MATDNTDRPKYIQGVSDADGYTVVKNIYIRLRDGIELCADVFLPAGVYQKNLKVPVICSLGPYGKDIHASEFGLPQTPIYADMYKSIKPLGPHACFELLDPLIWTKEYGYALLRVDSRGIGGSQGRLDPFGLERSLDIDGDAEGQDVYDVIEWAGTQPWSSGKVAMSGISYYGIMGYIAAMQKPPHLTCAVTYEASADVYQSVRRGGVGGVNFQAHWFKNIVIPYQNGQTDKNPDAAKLASTRADYLTLIGNYEYPDERLWKILKRRNLADIDIPIYTAGNWTDSEIHLPGNFLSFNKSSSKEKWLEMHTGNHLALYYSPEHVALQKKFLDHYLLGVENSGIKEVPRIRLVQRRGANQFYREDEASFPPPDVEEKSFYLTADKHLSLVRPSGPKTEFVFEGLTGTTTFELDSPFSEPVEILGTPFLEIELSTEAEDSDVFLCLRALDATGKPVITEGNHGEPCNHFAKGYFRLSHRAEIEAGFNQSEPVPFQPIAPRSEVEKGKIYSLRIPLYPTAFYLEAGQKISLEIGAQDTLGTIPPMRHDGGDRVPERFGGKNVLFSSGRIVLPQIHRPPPAA